MDVTSDQQNAMSNIEESEVSYIQFILDYVTVGFHDKAFTMLVWPEFKLDGLTVSFGEPGYRDALCSLIGQVVKSALIDESEIVRLITDDGSCLTIRLRDRRGMGERGIITAPQNYLYVF